jgi:hypothetical protein
MRASENVNNVKVDHIDVPLLIEGPTALNYVMSIDELS